MKKPTASECQSDQPTNSPNVLNGHAPDSLEDKPPLAVEILLLILFFAGVFWSVFTGKAIPAAISSAVFALMVFLAQKHSKPTEPKYIPSPTPPGIDPTEHGNAQWKIHIESDAYKAWSAQNSFSSLDYWCRFATGIQGTNRSSFKDAIDNIKNIATMLAIVAALNLLFNSKSPQLDAFNKFDPDWYSHAKGGFSAFILPLMIILAFQTFAVGYLWPKRINLTGNFNKSISWLALLGFTFATIFIGILVTVFWLRMVIYH